MNIFAKQITYVVLNLAPEQVKLFKGSVAKQSFDVCEEIILKLGVDRVLQEWINLIQQFLVLNQQIIDCNENDWKFFVSFMKTCFSTNKPDARNLETLVDIGCSDWVKVQNTENIRKIFDQYKLIILDDSIALPNRLLLLAGMTLCFSHLPNNLQIKLYDLSLKNTYFKKHNVISDFIYLYEFRVFAVEEAKRTQNWVKQYG